MKDKAVFMGIGTWYKYANRLGIKRGFFKLKLKHEIGIRASKPLEILHMDITIFKTLDNTEIYISFIVDNFSRAILNWKASTEYSSNIVMELLKGAVQKHNIKFETTLIADGGSENKGELSKYIGYNQNITKLIAQKYIIQSNSMVEAVNKHLKYYYLLKKHLKKNF
jgi:putative transposase